MALSTTQLEHISSSTMADDGDDDIPARYTTAAMVNAAG